MRVFEFKCEECGEFTEVRAEHTIPIGTPIPCPCGATARRVFSLPQIPPDSLSLDPDYVPPRYRVASDARYGVGKAGAVRKEAAYQREIEKKRAAARAGGNRGRGLKMTNSIPADLYHGKIRETGDRNYWDSPKNRKRHKSTEIR